MIRRILTAGVIAAGLCLAASGRARAADKADDAPQTGQHAYSFEFKGDRPATLGYLLYLPPEYGKDPKKTWPVIFFLHGSGEKGDGKAEINKVKMHGPPKVVEKRKDFPFIVISPQCPADQRGWRPDVLAGLLDDVMASHKAADADRVYLTGLSMGGFGTWSLAARHPDKFAAIAPVCGGGDPAAADKLKGLPTWVFHGEQDKTVPIDRSQAMVDAMKKAGATDVQFTKYPDKGHDSWTVTYDNQKLYDWFLEHKRGEKAGKKDK